jgi:small-conductance mechanosensitive channel
MNTKVAVRFFVFILLGTAIAWFEWEGVKLVWLQRVLFNSAEFLLFLTGTELIKQVFFFFYRKKNGLPSSQNNNVIQAIVNIHRILVAFVLIGTLLSFFNIHFKDLVTSMSIVAAAIAILSKDYVSNIISGMIIAFSRELEIGNQIKVGEHKGKIEELTISKVVLINDDDDVIYIPYNIAYSTEIINYSKRTIKKTSIEFSLKPGIVSSVEELEKYIKEVIKEYKAFIEPNSYNLKTEHIKKDYVDYKFQYILREPNQKLEREIKRLTIRSVVNLIESNTKG